MFGERMLELLCKECTKSKRELLSAEALLKHEERFAGDVLVAFSDDDILNIKGEKKRIKRVFVREKERKDDGVGWVLNEDVRFCMICGDNFSFYCWEHHCRACGNLVCSRCSPYTAEIIEFPEFGPAQRVCIQCGCGQESVHALKIRLRVTNIVGKAEYLKAEVQKKEKSYRNSVGLRRQAELEELKKLKEQMVEMLEEDRRDEEDRINERIEYDAQSSEPHKEDGCTEEQPYEEEQDDFQYSVSTQSILGKK